MRKSSSAPPPPPSEAAKAIDSCSRQALPVAAAAAPGNDSNNSNSLWHRLPAIELGSSDEACPTAGTVAAIEERAKKQIQQKQQQQQQPKEQSVKEMETTHASAASGVVERLVDVKARQSFADKLSRAMSGTGVSAASLLSLLMEKKWQQQQSTQEKEGNEKTVEALERCAVILKRRPAADSDASLRQLLDVAVADCTGLSTSAPTVQASAEQLVWLQFRCLLEANPAVSAGVSTFIDDVRTGQCVLFHRDTDEDTIVESLFPDYKYLIVSRGVEVTARALPELYDIRAKTSRRINEFHKTAGSDDCKVVEVDGPKVQVRKELRDLEARKLHVVTKELIDELYEFYRLEMLAGTRATTGRAHVPSA